MQHAITLTNEECAERIGAVLRKHYGNLRHATDRIGRAIGAHPRAVRKYFDGENCPPCKQLILLMAQCPPLAEEVMRIAQQVINAEKR